MVVQPAEESYNKGRAALDDGRVKEALALFEAAIELERRRGQGRPQARYLSYYGLCLNLVKNDLREALRFCREAATIEGFNPDIRCNLGQVLMRAGRRREAFAHFAQGLRVESSHRRIRGALSRMGIRRRPVIPFLHRRNPLNILLGRVRSHLVAA